MLSTRSQKWSKIPYHHGKDNTYHPTANPHGITFLNNAFNWLIYKDTTEFFNRNNHFDSSLCSYAEGYTGTLRLRTAMAKYMGRKFQPVQSIDPEEITFASGVTDLNEVCALVFCNPGEAIMLGRPCYGAFNKDLVMRTDTTIEWVDVGDRDQFTANCVTSYEAGYEAAKARGVTIKAMIICNPHNPLGQCYPEDSLIAIMKFCGEKCIHLISDEIYAMTTYKRQDRKSEVFTSVLSIDPTGLIDPKQIHVLYGMAKDFGAAGMRLGCVISRNSEFTVAAQSICRFSSPSNFSMDLAAKLLENEQFVDELLEKSRQRLYEQRLVGEKLLTEAGIKFHNKGNAGLFIWIDLSPFLRSYDSESEQWELVDKTNEDGWRAERVLMKRLLHAGVVLDHGEGYACSHPGWFRLMYPVGEDTLREGIKRIAKVVSLPASSK